MKCRNCGEKMHKDMKGCPAKDNKCSYGGTGHFKSVCYIKGKPRVPPNTKKEDSKQQEETGHALSASCISIKIGQDQDNLHVRRQLSHSELFLGQDRIGPVLHNLSSTTSSGPTRGGCAYLNVTA
jgi:hypothetical protein